MHSIRLLPPYRPILEISVVGRRCASMRNGCICFDSEVLSWMGCPLCSSQASRELQPTPDGAARAAVALSAKRRSHFAGKVSPPAAQSASKRMQVRAQSLASGARHWEQGVTTLVQLLRARHRYCCRYRARLCGAQWHATLGRVYGQQGDGFLCSKAVVRGVRQHACAQRANS